MRASNINGVTGAPLTTAASSLFSCTAWYSISWFLRPPTRAPYDEDGYLIGIGSMTLMLVTFPLALWLIRRLPVGRANAIVVLCPLLASSALTLASPMAGFVSIPIATVLSLIYCKRKIEIDREAVS